MRQHMIYYFTALAMNEHPGTIQHRNIPYHESSTVLSPGYELKLQYHRLFRRRTTPSKIRPECSSLSSKLSQGKQWLSYDKPYDWS